MKRAIAFPFILVLFCSTILAQTGNQLTAEEKFNAYKKESLKTKRLQFEQGYFDVYGTESYNFNRIIHQRPKKDGTIYDASGAIIIEESSQEIFWNKQTNSSTGSSAKIFFYISPHRMENINESTNLSALNQNMKNYFERALYSFTRSNSPQLKIELTSDIEIKYEEINGKHTVHGICQASSDVEMTIHTYFFYLKNQELLQMKISIANDNRKLIVEDLVSKMLSSLYFY